MTRNREWKERKARVLPGRMRYAKSRLAQEGVSVVEETTDMLVVRCHCNNVYYSPFTGGFTGKGIPNGKGLERLIELCKG